MRIALITARSPIGILAAATTPTPGAQHDGPSSEVSLARALAGHGHRVTLYARADSPDCPRTAIAGQGVSVEYVPAGPARPLSPEQAARYMPEFAADLAARWRSRPPAVVHAFTWIAGLAALGAVRGTQIPVVQTFESLGLAERRFGANADVPACRVKLESAIGHAAAAVLARSEAEASELARMAVPRAKIRVVPAAVDTNRFSPADSAREPGPKARLIAFAQPDQAPGLQTILRALAQLPDCSLTIVGGPDGKHLPRSGPFRELAQISAALGVRNRVTFAGQVAEADLPDLLRSADVLVSAASYEPAGTAALQAMACGLPVVGSAVGALADAVIDGVTGLLVAPEHPAMLVQRLRMLLARPALRQAFGIAAADRARSRYALDRIGQETVAAYERCLPAKAAEPAATLEDELAELAGTVDLRGVAAFA
jgi:glycosyltransferase involved in cell wall biosynthesis